MTAEQDAPISSTTARRKRLTRGEREQQILCIAEQVFANNGYQATSMDDIANQVGLSKPMLYEYFGSKDGLLVACIQRAKRELLDTTVAAVEHAASPEEMIHNGLLAYFQFADEHSQAWALIRNEAAVPTVQVNSQLEEIRQQQTEFTAGLLQMALPDADPVALEASSEAIIGACERLAIWRETRPEISPQQAAEYLVTLLQPSLTASTSG